MEFFTKYRTFAKFLLLSDIISAFYTMSKDVAQEQ